MQRRVSSPLDRRVTSRFGGRKISVKKKVLLGIAMLLGGPVISTSLAATLTISGTGTNAVEFGQGSKVAVACDLTINTAITETWDTATTRFKVSAIVLSGLNTNSGDTNTAVSDQGCGNRALKISLIDTGTVGTLTIGNIANKAVTVIIPTIQIDSTTVLTSAQYNPATGANAPDSTHWPLSTTYSQGTTELLGGKAQMSAAAGTNNTLTFFLPTNLSIDPAAVSRVALETL